MKPAARAVARAIVVRSGSELYLSWRFIRGNFPPSVVFCLAAATGAWHVAGAPWQRLPVAWLLSALFGWLFVYAHDLVNQSVGHAEDAVNKPHRPIPSGLCDPPGARRRFLVVAVLFIALAAVIGVWGWALLWLAAIFAYHYLGADRWWPTKGLYTAVGQMVTATGSWATAGQLGRVAWIWICAIILYSTGVCVLQDQRDLKGDKLVGRRTLPMVVGDRATRVIAALFLVAAPASAIVPFALVARWTPPVMAGEAGFAAACWYLAARVLVLRSRKADDLTYKLYAVLVCVLGIAPVLT